MPLFGCRMFGGANGSTSSSLLRSAACWKSSSWFSLRPGCMSTERPAPRPGTGVRPRIRSSVNARSGREPKEQRPDRGAGRGQTGPAASGYAVFVAPRLSRVPDGGSEGRAPTIRSARAVPGPAPQGVASQRPRAPGRQSPTSCASAARAAFDFAAQSPPTLSIRRYRGWPPQASSSQQGAHRILEQIR